QVTVQYDGRFEDDGSRFDDGSFDTTLGSGRTVSGFDNGLMGLAPGETATLHIPPAFAYGYDNVKPTPQQAQQGYPDMTKFNGRTLVFTVTIKGMR
ncbi:MAG TPA: FKBP-type peptidyl-prolyl cis-trans isomerase, partial [Candidatus Thermoplasmatota archaeon]|nr:FKBP-type peptidyl-prolyl cis-trans isomerase [Candidatus Thermoplasmatota archaeon]